MEIIRQREVFEKVEYSRFFQWEGCPGSGFGFPSDNEGNVDTSTLNPAALVNYAMCLEGVGPNGQKLIDKGVREETYRWVECRLGRCEVCGNEVPLDSFTCTCDECGTDYNSSGQRLAPRSQWGEETGESLDEILRIE